MTIYPLYEDDRNFLVADLLEDYGAEFEEEGTAKPVGLSCVTAGNPYILHCYPAHATELTAHHHEHLLRIAGKIVRSFRGSRPINRIQIVGHAATWKGISRAEYRRRALVRAENARAELRGRIANAGLGTKVEITVGHRADNEPLVDNMVYSSSRVARNNRAFNRRVEIKLIRGRKPKQKPVVICKTPRSQVIRDTTVHPIRWTCRIIVEFKDIECDFEKESGGCFRGSGFLIAPDIILTAGHNLHKIFKIPGKKCVQRFAQKAKIAFGFNGGGKPFGETVINLQEGTNMLVSKNWKRAVKSFLAIPPGSDLQRRMCQTRKKENQFDFGIIKLPRAIRDRQFKNIRDPKFGHWGIRSSHTLFDSDSVSVVRDAMKNPRKPFVHISGYPSKPGNGLRSVLQQRCISGVLKDKNSLILYEEAKRAADHGGASGGPIFINEDHRMPLLRRPVTWRLIGVHGHAGHGLILTRNVLDEIERMKKMLG